jgi:predicted  nucleic acid-binding Zn-ribbon protein
MILRKEVTRLSSRIDGLWAEVIALLQDAAKRDDAISALTAALADANRRIASLEAELSHSAQKVAS